MFGNQNFFLEGGIFLEEVNVFQHIKHFIPGRKNRRKSKRVIYYFLHVFSSSFPLLFFLLIRFYFLLYFPFLTMFRVHQTIGRVPCCKCGIPTAPNAANMCVNCLPSEVDIPEGLQKHATLFGGNMW